MKLYENVVIGNFLYSLGFSVCAKSKGAINPVSINLLQQTPVDRMLGDVLIEGSGTLRLIEFKQTTNKSNKERDKQKLLLESIGEDAELAEVSRSIHWFLETGVKENLKMIVTRSVPYLDAFSDKETNYDFNEFVQNTASEMIRPNPQFPEDLLKGYLRLVAGVNGKDTSGAGGLVLYFNKSGEINFCELKDIMQLGIMDRDYQNQMEKFYENKKSLENEIHQSKKRSPSRGM